MEDLEITLDTPIDEEKILLSLDDSMLFAINTLSCIVGEAKSRKTFFRDLLISKMFNNDARFTGEFEGKVLIVDTEQSKSWIVNSLKRLQDMGVNVRERVVMVAVKTLNPKERLKQIESKIQEHRPEIVVIDGIRDLLLDFNDIGESMMLINTLMRFVNDYSIHVNTILHLNPSSDKARGHLGTEVLNKCDAVLKVETKGKGPGAVSTVTSVAMRDRDIDTLRFRIVNNIPEVA